MWTGMTPSVLPVTRSSRLEESAFNVAVDISAKTGVKPAFRIGKTREGAVYEGRMTSVLPGDRWLSVPSMPNNADVPDPVNWTCLQLKKRVKSSLNTSMPENPNVADNNVDILTGAPADGIRMQTRPIGFKLLSNHNIGPFPTSSIRTLFCLDHDASRPER
jgi:hypothetical protein